MTHRLRQQFEAIIARTVNPTHKGLAELLELMESPEAHACVRTAAAMAVLQMGEGQAVAMNDLASMLSGPELN
jgi:hypothetical protein